MSLYHAERLARRRVSAAGVMGAAHKFLVVDFHAESRFLLVKTLLRKFHDAIIHEIDDAEAASAIVKAGEIDAVILHRTFDVSGVELVREFRAVDPVIPIVMVSGIDREEAALAAGANRFLHYDQWLRIGSVVESLLEPGAATAEPERQRVN